MKQVFALSLSALLFPVRILGQLLSGAAFAAAGPIYLWLPLIMFLLLASIRL